MTKKIKQPQFLKGEKIFLRPLVEADITSEYVRWLNDADLSFFIPSMAFPATQQSVMKYLHDHNMNTNNMFFAIIEKKTGVHIGNIKLGPIDWISRNAYFGRLIGFPSFRSKGYGQEAVRLILHYAFNVLNMHKIFAGCLSSNVAAIQSNKKCGLAVEAILKEKHFSHGRYHDSVILSITYIQYLKQNLRKKLTN